MAVNRALRPVRVVAITSGHAFGDRVIRRLGHDGIPLDALILTVQQNTPRGPAAQGLPGLAQRARSRMRARWAAWRRWPRLVWRTTVVDSLGDPRLHRVLVSAHPDVLILAGTGIVPASILSIPSSMTLNAHAGLLPWVRGVCPLEHALLRGVPLGATVHLVDAGIDTGPIVRRVLLPPTAQEDRVAVLHHLENAAIEALVDVVGAVRRGEPITPRPQSSRHPYGHWVTTDERAKAVALLANGEARRLYDRWRAAAGGDVLPDDDARLPGPER